MRINAAVLDTIELAIFCKKYQPSKTKNTYISNENTKDVFAKAFTECHSFEFIDDCILFVVDKTNEEVQEDLDNKKNLLRSQIISLRKTCERREDYKNQIYEYCNKFDLQWILEEIEK